jgi:ketosteroid isomerase-like protein
MAAEHVEIATRCLRAAGASLKTGDREQVYELLAQDVEWVVPMRTLHGIDEVREELIWGLPPENLDAEVELGEVEDLGEGCVGCNVREVYRWKQTGEFAHERRRRVEVMIRNGKISRWEMRVVG